MQKKTLRTILIVIVIAISLYQYISDEGNTAPVNTEDFIMLTEPADQNTSPVAPADAPETSAELPETPTEIPAEVIVLEEADGDFDFYVMALSWSPDYCAESGSSDPQQCAPGKKLDFVLHGLWPQYEQGYPSYCSTESMSNDLIDAYRGLYPSEKLFDHEWEKHGTCTGLSPDGYLLWSQTLKEKLTLPPIYDSPLEPFRTDAESLQEAFVKVNPEFSANSFAVYCSGSGRFLSEVFVCYEKDGDPRPCSAEILRKASKSCGQADFLVRNTR